MEDGDGSSLRDRLVGHALALLEAGERDVSLRAVARAAGVSAMAPYRHFADKSALMAAVAREGFLQLYQSALAADRSVPDPRGALVAQGMAYIAFARGHPALFRLMFADGAGMVLSREDSGDAYDLLRRRAIEIAPSKADAVTLGCWGIVHGLATLALDGRIAPDPGLEREALERMVAGYSLPTGASPG